jgi:predicted AlkP superfamily phosphohydrolase/phosphomutase
MILSFKPEEIHASTPTIDNRWWDKEWKRIIKKRTEGFLYLLKNYPVDIALLCYKALDPIQHRMFHLPDKIKEWYEIQDEEIDKLLNRLEEEPESITIFSDHGFKSIKHGFITGTHREIGIFLSTLDNNVKHIKDIHNLIIKVSR